METKRIKATMPVALINAVTEYQRQNSIASWAQALIKLVNLGLISEDIPPVLTPPNWGGDRYNQQNESPSK